MFRITCFKGPAYIPNDRMLSNAGGKILQFEQVELSISGIPHTWQIGSLIVEISDQQFEQRQCPILPQLQHFGG
ncbi:MAG TPA: hypothetical protein G4N92_00230 [Anaerolineae bacterium]|nr:hypothetical protein [Anaerolineae bacterium]